MDYRKPVNNARAKEGQEGKGQWGSLYIWTIFGAIWILIKKQNEIYFIRVIENQPIKF